MGRPKRIASRREKPETGENNKSKFPYPPLKIASSFRLLRLERRLRDTRQAYTNLVLRGSLIETSLDNHPEYDALSYTWGDPNLCEKIVIDGKLLAITANCASALLCMLRGKANRYIWVDSICINQANTPGAIKERSGQVGIMDEIYSHAVQVNVHLGDGDKASDVSCEALKNSFKAYRTAMTPGPGQEAGRAEYERIAEDVLTISPEYPYGKLHGIFRLQWFRRAWVLQEVVLAQNVVLYCGKHVMSLETVVIGADFTKLPHPRPYLVEVGSHWSAYLGWHSTLRQIIRKKKEGNFPSNFFSLFYLLCFPGLSLEATRPEDKIFALYGICNRIGYELPVPDYRKPLAVVYTETAQAVLHYDQDLELLSVALESSDRADDLPSWVPNFSGCARKWSPLSPPHMCIIHRQNPMISGLTKSQYVLERGGMGLKVKGRRLDTIRAIGQPWKTDATTTLLGDSPAHTGQVAESFADCVDSWFDVIQGRSDSPRGRSAIDLMVRVLTDDIKGNHPAISNEEMARYLCVLSAKSGNATYHSMFDSLVVTAPDAQEDDPLAFASRLDYAVKRINDSIWKALFRTTRDYLGMGTHTVTAGDIVVVFHGLPIASVIRPLATGYKYVGPAYVNGIMGGEFWNAGSATDDEWFVLI